MKEKTLFSTPGWDRLASGIEVIAWSRLAFWDGQFLQAAKDQDVFNAHWPKVDPKFGRWLCWLAFGVGAESVVKGAFGVKGYTAENFGATHPWKKILKMDDALIPDVSVAIRELATEVRNRDAHEYVPGVRDGDFPDVAAKYVPALNAILACLGGDNVRKEVKARLP